MSLRRLPLLAILLTALAAAPAAHAQGRAVTPAPDRQTVLPVWNKGSGKVEAVLLLEPTGEVGPGARWRFGNNSLDAAFGPGAGDSLGLLCNGTGGGDISSLTSHCLLASLGADGQENSSRRLSATTAFGRQGNRFGLTAGTSQGGGLPLLLGADGGAALARADHVEQNDLQVFGQKSIGEEAYVSIAGTYARARLVPLADAASGVADRWDSKTLSVGGGYGPFSANIVGRVVDMPGQPNSKWEGLGLGLTWRTPRKRPADRWRRERDFPRQEPVLAVERRD